MLWSALLAFFSQIKTRLPYGQAMGHVQLQEAGWRVDEADPDELYCPLDVSGSWSAADEERGVAACLVNFGSRGATDGVDLS
jgi:hypothetical protein